MFFIRRDAMGSVRKKKVGALLSRLKTCLLQHPVSDKCITNAHFWIVYKKIVGFSSCSNQNLELIWRTTSTLGRFSGYKIWPKINSLLLDPSFLLYDILILRTTIMWQVLLPLTFQPISSYMSDAEWMLPVLFSVTSKAMFFPIMESWLLQTFGFSLCGSFPSSYSDDCSLYWSQFLMTYCV